jgi:phage major head subunit gpT-like protein
MGVSTAAVAAATTAFNVAFRDGYTEICNQQGSWQSFAQEVQLNGKSTVFPILGNPPRFREWNGPRIAKEAQIYSFAVNSKTYEATSKVKVEDIEDDNLGLYDVNFSALGEAAALLPWDELIALLTAGSAGTCYDGQAFFSASHPKDPYDAGAGTQANLATSTALTASNVAAQVTAMTLLTDERGKLIRTRPTHLVVPQALEKTADEIIGVPLIRQNITTNVDVVTSNVLERRLQKLVIPDLDGDSSTTWYLGDFGKRVKPLVWGWRIRPQIQPPSMNQNVEFAENELVYGAKARGRAGYALWQLLRKMTA